jgi:hypothetical protein
MLWEPLQSLVHQHMGKHTKTLAAECADAIVVDDDINDDDDRPDVSALSAKCEQIAGCSLEYLDVSKWVEFRNALSEVGFDAGALSIARATCAFSTTAHRNAMQNAGAFLGMTGAKPIIRPDYRTLPGCCRRHKLRLAAAVVRAAGNSLNQAAATVGRGIKANYARRRRRWWCLGCRSHSSRRRFLGALLLGRFLLALLRRLANYINPVSDRFHG